MKSATLVTGKFPTDPRKSMGEAALALASENGFPIVGRHITRRDPFGLAAGALCALLLGGVTFWSMSSHRPEPAIVVAPVTPAPPHVAAPPQASAMRAPAIAPAVLPHGETGLASVRIAAPALILDSASESAAARAALAAPPGAVRSMLGPDALPDATSAVNAMSATRMADPSNTVAQGTMMAAVLETAINSDLPGYVRAVVSEDVRGFDATLLLIPRGSHLIGQYKSGLADGQQRAYILWSRLLRPDGVSVDLASSPATDFAGNTGLTGDVDSHFFERFGSALLLSVVDMLSAVGGASVVISGSQSASSIALQHDGQIPPTVTVPQGTPIRIFTVRDLDFSTVAGEMAQK